MVDFNVWFVIQHYPYSPERVQFVEQFMLPLLSGITLWPDVEQAGTWPTCRVILEAGLSQGYSHVVILQDDVYPCRDFMAGVERAIVVREDSPFSCFWASGYRGGWGRYVYKRKMQGQAFDRVPRLSKEGVLYRERQRSGYAWMQVDFYSAQCIVYPTVVVRDYLAWIDREDYPHNTYLWSGNRAASDDPVLNDKRVRLWDDWRFWKYMRHLKMPRWVTVPSLVEHLGDQTTLVEEPNVRAFSYIGATHSALDVDWGRV